MEDGIESYTSILLQNEREKEKIDIANTMQEIETLLKHSDEEIITVKLNKNIWRTIVNLCREV